MIIINIGDELLIGQVINTNASFMATKITSAGFNVEKCIVIRDIEEEIFKALTDAFNETNFVVMSGGLGPTKDDKTKEVICKWFDTKLVYHEPSMLLISKLLTERGLSFTGCNKSQAMVPASGEVLPNYHGTAQGIWIEKNGKILAALPGVPIEMKHLLTNEVLPKAVNFFNNNLIIKHKVIQTAGISESILSDMIEEWELNLPPYIKPAYLPKTGIIRLRLTGKGDNEISLNNDLQKEIDKLKQILGNLIWSYEDNQIEEEIGKLLKNKGKTLTIAESCTGGNISKLITSVPGCSDYYKGGIVCYSNDVKKSMLNVRELNLKKYGAVSEQVVCDMALNAMSFFDTDYSIATSGIAGPDGGSEDKPVGTVWIAVASNTLIVSKCFHFGTIGGRENIIQLASVTALNMLRLELLKL